MTMYITSKLLPLAIIATVFSGVDLLLRGKSPGSILSYNNIFILFVLFGVFLDVLYRGRFRLNFFIIISFIFMIIGFLSGFVVGVNPIINGIAVSRGFVLLFAIHQVVINIKYWNRLKISILLLSIIAAFSIFVQELVFLIKGTILWGAQYSINYVNIYHNFIFLRASGFINDPNTAAIYLLAGFVLLQSTKVKRLKTAGILFILLAIFLTFSRGAILALVLYEFIYKIVFSRFIINISISRMHFIGQLLIIGLITFVGAIIFIFRENEIGDISNNRFEIWSNTIDLILQQPLFGWGFGGYQLLGVASHNLFLEILLNTGLIGFMLFIFMIYLSFPQKEIYCRFYQLLWGHEILIIILFASLFISTLTNCILWISIGLAFSSKKLMLNIKESESGI